MRHLSKSGIITLKALGGPIGSRTAQVQEQQLEETKFIAFFMGKKIDIEGKDLYDAKQKAITQLKVPKSKVGLLAVVSAESQRNQNFKFESVNEGVKIHFEKKLKDGNIFQVIDRDTTGMRGSQDKFLMQIVDKRGKVVKPIGSHISIDGAKKYSNKFESVTEGKKAFKINPPIGSSKYSISAYDGIAKHKDGSPFWNILIFKNKADLERRAKYFRGEKWMMIR
jgi:hypothetical protein